MTPEEWTQAWQGALRAWDAARAAVQDADGPYVDAAIYTLKAAEARLSALWAERPRRPA